MTSLREAILSADDLKREPVNVPEWGVKVYVRTVTLNEKDRIESAILKDRASNKATFEGLRALWIAAATCDENGQRVFSDIDVQAIGGKSSGAADRLFQVIMRLNAVGAADQQELLGNSGGGPAANSPSDSRSPSANPSASS